VHLSDYCIFPFPSFISSTRWDVPEGDDNVLGIGLKGDQGGILGVVWGNDDDDFDPLTQVG